MTPREQQPPSSALSGVQQAFWIGRNAAFELGNVGARRYLEADIENFDVARFERAWRALVTRHDALRTVVTAAGERCVITDPPEYKIVVQDLTSFDGAALIDQLERIRETMCRSVGDLASWPPFEVRVSLLGSGRARVHLDLDLIVADADSVLVLGNELKRLYNSEHLDDLPDYPLPAKETSGSVAAEGQTGSAWRQKVTELPPAPQLPLACEPSAIETPSFVRLQRQLPADAWRQLRERAVASGVGMEAALAAAFGETLASWSKESSFTITRASSVRPSMDEADLLVDNFTTLVPVALDASPLRPFRERAANYERALSAETTYELADDIEVVRQLNQGGRRLAAASTFVFMPSLSRGLPRISDWALGSGSVVFDLTRMPQVSLAHEVRDTEDGLEIVWHALDGLFPDKLVDEVVNHHFNLLKALADSSDAWVMPSPECLPEDQWRIREATNSTTDPIPDLLLHEVFWKQASKTPDDPAVITEDRTLTYRQIRAGGGALAERLREVGARPNRMIAIVMEKGWEQVVAVMGILQSGAAYVPVEPDLPEERFHYLLQHSEVDCAVVQPHLLDALPWPARVRRIVVDEEMLHGEGPAECARLQGSRDLAYVIYTSGSTGLPKGVMIDHRGALNTVLDINRRFSVDASDRVLALTPLSFDLSVYDLFGPFERGGAIVMPSAGTTRAPWHWAEMLQEHQVTLWNTVPALMEMLVGYAVGRRERITDSLRLVMMSGDWIPVSLPGRIRPLATDNIEIVSLGGATEASIWSVYYRIGAVDASWTSIPYGKPLANQTIEVLDEALRRRPDWVPGEQYVGGFGVAMGYWRDEEKTRRSFIKHPRTGERLYRTGDLGRYFPDGNVEFLGREDFQVKVHGYRIELGEIEATLLNHPDVTSSVVTAIGAARGEKRLVAYVTVHDTTAEHEAVVASINQHLAGKLPSHMIPAHVMVLEKLPLTQNGKVDRKGLPVPQMGRKKAATAAEVGVTELESQMLDIWRDHLSGDIDVNDDPLACGGTSLHAAMVHYRITQELAPGLKFEDLLRCSSIRALAAVIGEQVHRSVER